MEDKYESNFLEQPDRYQQDDHIKTSHNILYMNDDGDNINETQRRNII